MLDTPKANVVNMFARSDDGVREPEQELMSDDEFNDTLRKLSRKDTPKHISIPRSVSRARLEQAFLNAFEMIGGQTRLALWANDNPNEFSKLVGRLFPQAISGPDGSEPVKIMHAIPPGPLDRVHPTGTDEDN